MPHVKLDKYGLIEEDSPCWNCDNAYVEDIWFEWMCKAKECPYQEEQEVKEQISDAIHETAKNFRQTIVRCKDCRYWLPMNRFHQDYHPGRGDCKLNCWVRDSDWFCADGERRNRND